VICSLYYAFTGVSIHEVRNAFHLIDYAYVLPAVIMVAVSFSFRAVRWRYLIASVKTVNTFRLYSPLMVGFMGNMLPARAGEFIRAYLLSRKEHISYSSSFATIFIERLFDLLIVLVLIIWLLLFNSHIFVNTDSGNHILRVYMIDFAWLSFIICLIILLISILFQYRNDLAMKIVNFSARPLPETWREKFTSFINAFVEGLKIVKNKRRSFFVMVYSFLVCIAILFTYYFLFLAFKIDVKLPVITSVILLCLTIDIFITVFPSPGFLGSFQAACIVALHEIYDIPKATALSFSIIAWLVFMGFTVFVGAVFAIKDNISVNELLTSNKEVP